MITTKVMVRNFTPHPITIYGEDGCQFNPLPSEGVARVQVTSIKVGHTDWAHGNVPILSQTIGEVEGLPEEQEGVLVVVSRMVASVAKDRKDLVVPCALVRDPEGKVIGCEALEVVVA